jgi:hypothetical protein
VRRARRLRRVQPRPADAGGCYMSDLPC